MNRNWYIQPRTTFEELPLLSPVGSQNWFQNGLHKRLVDLVVLFCLFWIFKLNENVVALQITFFRFRARNVCRRQFNSLHWLIYRSGYNAVLQVSERQEG